VRNAERMPFIFSWTAACPARPSGVSVWRPALS